VVKRLRSIAAALLAALVLAAAASADEEVLAGLSQTQVALTADFVGSEILVFGAIRREAPTDPGADPLQIIVTIEGPSQPLVVWRKARRGGIWINVDSVRVGRAPSFYAVATSAPFNETLSATEDLRHRVSIGRAVRATGARLEDAPLFTDALIRLRQQDGLYQKLEGQVNFERETLFSTTIALPANLTEGRYSTRIFLTRGGDVVDMFETGIEVQKVGLERTLYQLAHERPALYGILAVVLAVVAGWGASEIFRFVRS